MVEQTDDSWKPIVKGIILSIVIMFGIIAIFSALYTIPSGYNGVLLTFSKASTIAQQPGLHIKVPFFQKVVKMDVRTLKYEAPASAASKDLQVVTATIVTNYRIIPDKSPNIFTNLGIGYADIIIKPVEQEAVKATTAKFTAEELITKREEVRLEIKRVLEDRLKTRDILVEEVSIVNFDFSDSFNEAIESKVTAEQLKLKADNDLQRIKVEAQQAEAIAIGQKNAKIAQAQGDAEAIRIIDEQLKTSPTYTKYLTVQRWNGILPQVTGGATPLISIE